MSERVASPLGDQLTVPIACGVAAVLVALFGLTYKPPDMYFGAVAHAPALLPWWGRAVCLGGAGVLLLVGIALLPFALRRVVLTPRMTAYRLLELPPALSIPVAALLMAMGALLALSPVIRYAAYGWDMGRLYGEASLGVVQVLSGMLAAATRRLTVIDRDSGRVVVTWGKPLPYFSRSYDLSAARGVILQTIHRTHGRPTYRIILLLPKGAELPLELWWQRADAERALHRFAAWSGVPVIENNG